MAQSPLFQPFSFGSLRLKNRIVMAPLTRSFSPGGVPTDDVTAYYRRRAEAEVGLIVTEGVGVQRPASLNDPNVPVFYGDKPLAAWERIARETHEGGGLIAPQLWHVGAVRTRRTDWTPPGPYDSPSGLLTPGQPFAEPMTDEEVADCIDAFGRAAGHARRLGFDAVEVHGAHGYLIDQFFWEGVNLRNGRWGGDTLVERARFAADILRAVRAAVGPAFPVIIRLSQWKQQDYAHRMAHTPKEMEAWLGVLSDAGADMFHCSQRRFWEPEFPGLDPELNFAGWAKKLMGKPTIAVGSVGLSGEFIASIFESETSQPASLDELERRMDRGDFDLIAVGRALLQDPHWVVKVRDGRFDELKPYSREAMGVLY